MVTLAIQADEAYLKGLTFCEMGPHLRLWCSGSTASHSQGLPDFSFVRFQSWGKVAQLGGRLGYMFRLMTLLVRAIVPCDTAGLANNPNREYEPDEALGVGFSFTPTTFLVFDHRHRQMAPACLHHALPLSRGRKPAAAAASSAARSRPEPPPLELASREAKRALVQPSQILPAAPSRWRQCRRCAASQAPLAWRGPRQPRARGSSTELLTERQLLTLDNNGLSRKLGPSRLPPLKRMPSMSRAMPTWVPAHL